MVCHHVSYELGLLALLWLFLMLHVLWPSARPVPGQKPRQPVAPPRQRCKEPTPFAGLTCKPHCDVCEQAVEPHPYQPSASPPRMISTRGRRRQVDTSHHFCPDPDCPYGGWLGQYLF
jgi:hypothetical protein